MIYSLEVSDPARSIVPWWKDVPFLQGKKQIEFGPGLTLVFGPNGSGKSTILVTIAKALCAWQGGVSKLTESSIGEYNKTNTFKEKGLLEGVLPTHDGRGVLFLDPTKAPGASASYIDDEFGFEQIRDRFASRASAGQVTLGRVQGLFESIEDPSSVPFPDTSFVSRPMNELWTDWAKRVEQIVRGSGPLPPPFLKPEPAKKSNQTRSKQPARSPEVPKRAPDPRIPTILLDEPDRSLSIPWAANLWANLADKADKDKVQIIAATHCPFAIDLPGVTYLETEPGYLDRCRTVYRQIGKRIGQ